MPILNGCCCYEDLKKGSRASGGFTFVSGILNIAICLWMLVKLHEMDADLVEHEKWVWMPPGILVFMYVQLANSIALLFVSCVLIVGINRDYAGKRLVWTWVYGVIFFRIYEFCLGVYIIAFVGGFRIPDVVYMYPIINVIWAYWFLGTAILIAAILCVVSYWQQLKESIFGRERRVKKYRKLTNIVSAYRSGTATPRSHNMGASRMTLASSQMSLHSLHTHASHPSMSMGSIGPISKSEKPPMIFGPPQGHPGGPPLRSVSQSSHGGPPHMHGGPGGPPMHGGPPPGHGGPPPGQRGPQMQGGPPPMYGGPQMRGPPQGPMRGGPPQMHGGPPMRPPMHGGPPPMYGGPPMHGGPPPGHRGPPPQHRGPPMPHPQGPPQQYMGPPQQQQYMGPPQQQQYMGPPSPRDPQHMGPPSPRGQGPPQHRMI